MSPTNNKARRRQNGTAFWLLGVVQRANKLFKRTLSFKIIIFAQILHFHYLFKAIVMVRQLFAIS